MPIFPRNKRLLTAQDYQRVFRGARRVAGDGVSLLIRKNDQQARLGLAISKKHIPRAVDRNRLKRLLRETFRTSGIEGWDIVAVSHKKKSTADKKTLHDSLERLWLQLND